MILTLLWTSHPATAHLSILTPLVAFPLLFVLGILIGKHDREPFLDYPFRAWIPFYLALSAFLSQVAISMILGTFWAWGELRMDLHLGSQGAYEILRMQGWIFALLTPLLLLTHAGIKPALAPILRARALAARLARAQDAPRYLRQVLAHIERLAQRDPLEAAQAIEQFAPMARQLAALPEGQKVPIEVALRWAELPLSLERKLQDIELNLDFDGPEEAPEVPALLLASLIEEVRGAAQEPPPTCLRVGLERDARGTWILWATFGPKRISLPLQDAP